MKTTVYALAFAVVSSGSAIAADYTVKTYNISGKTTSAIHAAMKSKGPGGNAGETVLDGPGFLFDPIEEGGNCVVKNPKITSYKLVVTMPKWTDEGSASSCVVNSYKKMREALLRHEERHVKLFIDAKPELLAAILGVSVPGSCTAETAKKLKQAAQDAFQAQQALVQKQNNDFDTTTQHGVADDPPVVLSACP